MGGYYDKSDSTAVQNLVKSLNPNAVVSDAHPPKGPDGKSGGFVWGNAAHIVAFGKHLEKDDAKLKKILEILNTMVSDDDVMLHTRIGEEGVTYKLSDGSETISDGIDFLPPYDDATYRKESGYVQDFGSASFFMPVTPTYESYLKYTPKAMIEAYKEAAGDSVGTTDAFLKPDVLPSSSEYFETLRNAQIKLMVDIITGVKNIDDYMPEFSQLWQSQGGNKLDEETVPMAESIDKILSEVGAK